MTPAPDTNKPRRIEVFCLTYGEPAQNEVAPQYEYSLSILNRLTRRVAPIPKFVTPLLAKRRAKKRVENFTEKNWTSPLEDISHRQVAALKDQLRKHAPDIEFNVTLVFEFRPPYIWTFLEKLKQNPPDAIILLPLYVAESDFTTGVSRTDLATFHREHKGHRLPGVRYVEGFGFDPDFGKVMADFVWNYCVSHGWTEEKTRSAALIMGAHGTLVYPPPGVNSGWKETCHLYGMIRSHLRAKFATTRIGWLNHTLGGKWTFPEVKIAGEESQASGVRKVVYFPFGFMADNGESMLEGKEQLGELTWDEMLYLPCPNDDPAFIDYLAKKVVRSLDAPAENWDNIDRRNELLVRKEQVAVRSRPGFMKFTSPILALVAALFWTAIGVWLTARGIGYTMQIDAAWAVITAIAFGLVVGTYKGVRVLGRMAMKNLARLRTLPQPSPLYKMFAKPTWLIILFFSCVGMTISILGLPPFVRGSILNAVGFAMIVGAVYYFANLGKAKPTRVVEMSK